MSSSLVVRRSPLRSGLLAAILGVGAMVATIECQPPEGAECNSPADNCKFPSVVVCLDRCVSPVPLGGACSHDPCATDGTCAGAGTCVDILGSSRCLQGVGLASPCALVQGVDPCASGLYCRVVNGQTTTCAVPAPIGAPCDSNFSTPGAFACTPGTHCIGATGGSYGRCKKDCSTALECPCDGTFECRTDDPAAPSYCCVAADRRCARTGDCCNSSDICRGPNIDRRCGACIADGQGSCGRTDDCCRAGSRCYAGTCTCTPQPGACVNDAECCAGLVCARGSNTSGPGTCFPRPGGGGGGGGSDGGVDSGDAGGPIASFHLLGFEQFPTSINSVPTYDYQVPGTPTDFDVLENVFLGLTSPQNQNQVVTIDVGNAQNATPIGFPTRPDLLSAFLLPGGAPPPTVADILVGGGSRATFYERFNFTNGSFITSHTATPLVGSVIALSGSPGFAKSSVHDAAALTNTGVLYWIDFGQVPPVLNHQVSLGSIGLGAPAAVSAGDAFAFVATSGPHRLSRLTTPTLGNLASTPPLPAFPVVIGGSENDLLVVVAERAVNNNRLEGYFPLNLGIQPAAVSLPGEPVALTVRTLGQDELVWVATKNPNEVRLFRVNAGGFSPIASVALGTAEPVRLRIGLSNQPPSVDAGPSTDPTLNGFVHVLVRQ